MRRRVRAIFAACATVVVAVFLASATLGRGGRGDFSPDTLDCRTQAEWLLPIANVVIFRGPASMHRYPAVDYLIAQGFWSPSPSAAPRWLPTFRWNAQWRDGESRLHRELGQRGDDWVRWSNDNPELARALWPRVLTALRRCDARSTADAALLMDLARSGRTTAEFEKDAAELLGATDDQREEPVARGVEG